MGSKLSRVAPRCARRGQAVTELALVIPILLMVLIGIVEFGRAWMMSQVVTDAARQGARTASLLSESSVGQDSVVQVISRALLAGRIDPAAADIDIDGFQDGTGTDVTVTVGVPYGFGLLAPIMRIARQQSWDDEPITLQSRAVMRNE
jgi:Flp pilus assembly protein TadG